MKCIICDGKGIAKVPTNKEIICPDCNGTGELSS